MSTLEAHHAPAANDDVLLLHHFDDVRQQHDATILGMWAFLATEVMFFGGVIAAYSVFRFLYFPEFAEASHHLNMWVGFLNTGVLLGSSLTVAMAVRTAQLRRPKRELVGLLVATMVLGAAFLGIKAYEWYVDYQEHLIPFFDFRVPHDFPESLDPRRFEMFFVLYFCMTGLHAFHMVVGLAVAAVIAHLAWRGWLSGGGETHVEVFGLYWHFVDIVWVFLYPLLYLIEAH